MPPHNQEKESLLDVFLTVARDSSTIEDPVLECGLEQWTYGDLDSISSGLALQLYEKYGLRPTVAVISENHPYMLAILLATWKLGGIFAPLDPHSPLKMVKKMLENVGATCSLVPDDEERLKELLQGLDMPIIMFSKDTSITSLTQRYLDQTAEISPSLFPLPSPSSLAAYLHTSSASSISDLKCVQLTHESIARGSRSLVKWFCRTWPLSKKLKVLGFSPWTHIMAISHDLGGATFGMGGCFVFGVSPSGYPLRIAENTSSVSGKAEKEMDVLDQLLETAMRTKPDIFLGVPWVLEGFKQRYTRLLESGSEKVALEVKEMLHDFKSFGVAGAAMTPEVLQWAKDMKINVSHNIGMTEFGGPLFHTGINPLRDDDEEGWQMEDCFIEDAKLALLDGDGKEDPCAPEGELVVTSRCISRGYLKYDNSSFSESSDGWITFKTGDIYFKKTNGRLAWKGRKDDYIQMVSGETLDPRAIEKVLNACPAIAHCCVVGNNFMKKPSDVICVLIEPALSSENGSTTLSLHQMAQITRAVAAVNRTLLPPLRIAWSRVGILHEGMAIPYTKKGGVFRKKLEALFGEFLASLLAKHGDRKRQENGINGRTFNTKPASPPSRESPAWNRQKVESMITETVAGILGIEILMLDANSDTSFAEFGMDSSMAVRIVNQLNTIFSLKLPLNACHTLIDLSKISEAILVELGMKEERPNLPKQPRNPTSTMKEDIVIVGQALRLPGDINTPESFWEALIKKRDDIMTPVPTDRWDHPSFYRPPSSTSPPQICDISFKKAGFVDVAHFDNNFFGISAPEAIFISPSIRLTLETAFEALENACIPVARVKGTSMGVFIAAGLDDGYNHMLFQSQGWDAYTRFFGTGISASTASGRLSYLLDVHGPSTTTDTACSSGLVVLDQAVKYLQSGDGESAIVAAVNTNLWPGSFGFLSAQKMVSPNSRCATFTDEADGYVPSEGSIAVILKTKNAAIRDGDNILAVIKSTDVMHGGKSQGLVAPNVTTQIALQQSLLAKAGLEPSQIDFLETHGTGTPMFFPVEYVLKGSLGCAGTSLGDLIEIQGINEVFQGSHPQHPLLLGAAKSCVGHTELAAGLVGLLKAIASFKHASVPGLVHLTEHNMNPSIDCEVVPIQIPYKATRLPSKDNEIPNRGLVLSNGFAGTIAGAILEEPKIAIEDMSSKSSVVKSFPMLFVVSAKSVEGLKKYMGNYLDFCRSTPASQFADMCYTTCIGREHYRYRFSCIASNMQELINHLEERFRTFVPEKCNDSLARRIAFVFPGQGSQYQGMASNLADCYPEFKDILSFACASASRVSGYPILSFLVEKTNSFQLNIDDSQIAQICIFVYQYSLSLWLKTLGIEAYAVLGHSLGEISAAVVAGAMDYEIGLELVVKRAELLRSDPSRPGGMAIIATSREAVLQLIRQLDLDNRLVIAVYNGPESHVVSGELSAIDEFLASAKIRGLKCTKLNVGQGFHSPLIYPGLPALQMWIDENRPSFSRLSIPLYSTVYGSEILADSQLQSSYWVEHARDPVKFSHAAEELIANRAIDVILDLGPQPFIWTALQALPHQKSLIAMSTKPSNDQNGAFLRAFALLFEHGVTPDFEKLFSRSPLRARKIAIPTYPFQRQRHYPDSIPSRNQKPSVPLILQAPLQNPGRTIQFPVNQALYDLLSDHRIEGHRVAPGASLVDFFAKHSTSGSIKSITFHSPLVLESPHFEITGHIDLEGPFYLCDGYTNTNYVCSGILATSPTFSMRTVDNSRPPDRIKNKAEIYECFKSVQFGPSFRNIQEIRSWSTHADAFITVHSTPFPTHDRMRKIDCCLHAFGAILQGEVPQLRDLDGAFLPTSLDDFTLHSDDLPESFICRYHLPLDVTRNFHVISLAFDVLSLSGDLLISCSKYAVAWIPAGVVVQDKKKMKSPEIQKGYWLRQTWIQRNATQEYTLPEFSKYDQLLFVAPQDQDPHIVPPLSTLAKRTFSVHFPSNLPDDGAFDRSDTSSIDIQFKEAFQEFAATETLIVLDLTSVNAISIGETFGSCHRHVLRIMQLLSSFKVNISNLVVITEMSVSAHLAARSMDIPLHEDVNLPSVGAVIQGMVRVFRRETGFDTQIWALDLPPLNSMTDDILHDIILRELNARRAGLALDRTVAYRKSEDGTIERLVPVLRVTEPLVHISDVYSGTSVIVGLGSIGSALATSLISNGCSLVVFIGRRPSEDIEIRETMCKLETQTKGRVSYVQADVCDSESLRRSIVDIQARHGAIENVIHSAAVISDASIQNVDNHAFERVLRPKVMGALNLHIISEELIPSLKSFVLLSSISVSLGNYGQVAYVAGNSYMEALATYRRGKHLPATALQLGPWESRLIQKLDTMNSLVPIMDNERGIPLVLKAMFKPDAVQVIANLDLEKFAMTPAYSQDPLFQDILPSTAKPSARPTRTESEVSVIVTSALRTVLELNPSEKLETADSLTACGIDSISFAQIRGKIMNDLDVEVPMMYSSDSFTILEMILYVVEKYRSLGK